MLAIVPLTLLEANDLVARWHRHHARVVGYRFALGCWCSERRVLVGSAIIGRPVARMVDQYNVAEVTRLATDGTPNACSILYAAAARAARAMGYQTIQTYILHDEPGTSLRAAGWEKVADIVGGNWNHSWRKGRREDQPMSAKQRWEKRLNQAIAWDRHAMRADGGDGQGVLPLEETP